MIVEVMHVKPDMTMHMTMAKYRYIASFRAMTIYSFSSLHDATRLGLRYPGLRQSRYRRFFSRDWVYDTTTYQTSLSLVALVGVGATQTLSRVLLVWQTKVICP